MAFNDEFVAGPRQRGQEFLDDVRSAGLKGRTVRWEDDVVYEESDDQAALFPAQDHLARKARGAHGGSQ